MEGINCDACFHQYDEDERQPRTLFCGHTLCTVCITNGITGDKLMCPLCRETHNVDNASAIPVSFSLLKVARTFAASGMSSQQVSNEIPISGSVPLRASLEAELHAGICLEHGSYRIFWCCKCLVWICRDCTVVEHPTDTCAVVSIKQAMSKIKEVEDTLVTNTVKSRDVQVNILNDYLIKLSMHVQNQDAHIKDLQPIIDRPKEAKCLLEKEQKRVKSSLNESHETLEKMASACKMLSKENTVEGITRTRHECQMLRNNLESWIKISKDELSKADTALMSEKIHKKFPLALKVAVTEMDAPSFSLLSFFVDHALKIREKLTIEDLNYILINTPVWGSLDDGSRVAPVSLENNCLYLHALRNGPPPDNVLLVPYQQIRYLVKKPLVVFIDITYQYPRKGRVFIATKDNYHIAKGFIERCSGENPKSYLNSKMIQVLDRNTNSERLCFGGTSGGGNVTEPTESQACTGKFNNTQNWVTECTSNGLTTFAIWHKNNPYKTESDTKTKSDTRMHNYNSHQAIYNTPQHNHKSTEPVENYKNYTQVILGRVTNGLHIIQYCSGSRRIPDVTISDCGLVIQ